MRNDRVSIHSRDELRKVRLGGDAETSTRAACAPQIVPGIFEFVHAEAGLVLIRRDLTEYRLSILTPADEIQLGAALFRVCL